MHSRRRLFTYDSVCQLLCQALNTGPRLTAELQENRSCFSEQSDKTEMLLNAGEIIAVVLFLFTAIHRSSSFTTVVLYDRCDRQHTLQANLLSLDMHILKIEGSSGGVFSSCSVTFRASQSDTDLYYKFTEASINSIDINIKVYTSSSAVFGFKPTRIYSSISKPRLNDEIKGKRYIKITVTKGLSSDFSAKIQVYAQDNIDLADIPTLQVWIIACIVVSCIIFVVIVVVVIACMCKKSHGYRGQVVAPAAHTQVTTATVTHPGQYTYPYHSGAIPPPPSYNQLELQPLPSQPSPAWSTNGHRCHAVHSWGHSVPVG